jgi:hypothetical protein
MAERARWTFMVYMAGDNNLSDAGDRDLAELRKVGSTADVNFVVEFDNAGPNGTRRFLIQKDGQGETVETLGETDSGSPDTLSAFITWAAATYPAERYALVLWNHGGGWTPTEVDRLAHLVASPGYVKGEGAERSGSPLGRTVFRTSLARILSLPDPSERAICSDDGSGHSLDMLELGRVLAGATQQLGRPLDLLGCDACLMANLEVAYQVKPYAKVLVASEELEPNQGWPYDVIAGQLAAEPTMDGPTLAGHIVSSYLAYYEAMKQTPVTQAALDLARMDSLTTPLDALAEALTSRMPDASRWTWDAQRASPGFHGNTLWDIAAFARAVGQAVDEPAVRSAAESVVTALQPGPERLVLAAGARGDKVAQAGGLSVYLLPSGQDLSRYYPEVDFAINHRWRGFLEAYHDA